ncbi:glycosyltransferase family 2 protein [Brucella intermedia]|uniref:glycosyltransferase family 2 protein n=1 Tax=Brucella intermedia TaxID=94625 RepID=UPI00124EAF95|nr:glycosyltransferase family 2 protein [Brucella intermedia]KAB2715715.1 glycosyltransferase family 2 protein [Brucella intermedia]KAB2717793.1 glycosyltransferase family 2 protein [Brucella intermedia]
MTKAAVGSASSVPDTDVPAYEVMEFAPKTARYCIVIPVINEGERIGRQLVDMHRLGQAQASDIIIADGGSKDGSLKHAMLRANGVSVLLTKTGTGKLSAQLRMAYAYALDRGYDGIITIDGNGKDSVQSIPLFIDALDRGVDYAQASRFISGGKAINTPRSRELAIKFLHAPILSLAARRRYTDTTQGFRAYSRRYLMHPRVQPLRDVFMTYELLAYLTVRASQLGLKTEEIPTTRAYPDHGPIPTKINMAGNIDLMKIIFCTLAGRYNP